MTARMTPRLAGRDVLGAVTDLGPVTARQLSEYLGMPRSLLCKTAARLVRGGQLRRVQHRPARWELATEARCLDLTAARCILRQGSGPRYAEGWHGGCACSP